MVAYLLKDDADPELIESYTQTFTLIAKEYAKSRSKDRVNIEVADCYWTGLEDFKVGDRGYIAEFSKNGDYALVVIDGRIFKFGFKDFKVID